MKRMLFNATQQEELRVAIVDGQKLIDIDIETAGREQRKSNIYKGVITRIEPSLEACFVSYGEDRHGFLPFKEVARTYFREGCDVRNATIKEALREGQEIMVQVEKEERGNKGAALTSFISLAGRYLVLMPNNPRGGGVSRRVEGEERQELRETMDKLDLPQGMSVIARTAGIGRNVDELQWDLNYLMQLWRAIEGASKSASGAFLIYQESSLVIRAIRDYYQPDIGEILIDTDEIYEQAHQFMSHVMPDMVHRVKRYSDDVPLFSRFQIEHQIETAYSRTVPLPSGGAIVIDHTEALVSVDVNSARATRGSDIETTAFNTNCEAAEEVARQLRLRDLAGLIVIDFIDMEASRNDAQVERRLKEALKHDRARIQVGRISHFGLLEMSRQRLRPSVTEHSFETCPHCQVLGIVRSADSAALQVLRAIEEEGSKGKAAEICVHVAPELALHLLNRKRDRLAQIEQRYGMQVVFEPDSKLLPPALRIERTRAQLMAEASTTPAALRMDYAPEPAYVPEPEAVEPAPRVAEAVAAEAEPAHDGEPPRRAEGETGEGSRRRRRRRRRGGRREDGSPMTPQDAASEDAQGGEPGDDQGDDQGEGAVDREDAVTATQAAPEAPAPVAAPRPERQPEGRRDDRGPRRDGGRREDGIRRRGRRSEGFRDESRAPEAARPAPEAPARYVGPTPANPFAGGSLEDIFDAMAAAEEAALRPAQPAVSPQPAPVEPQVVEPQAAEPVAAPAPEPVTAAEPVAAAPAAPEAVAEPAPEAPAKPRARRAAKPKAVAEAATAAEPPLAQPPVAEASAPEEAPAAKPKRAPRGRKAEAAPAASPAEATVAAAEGAAPAKPARRRAAPKRAEPAPPPPAAAETVSGEVPATAPVAPAEPAEPASATSEPVAAAPVQPVLVESSPDAPKKRGWWKR